MLRLAIACGGLLLTSCSYLQNRANDALDVFLCEGALGPGLYAELRATDFAAVGLGLHTVATGGLHGRYVGTGERGSLGLGPFILGGARGDYGPVLSGDPSTFDDEADEPCTQMLVMPSQGIKCEAGYSPSARGLRMAYLSATATVGYVGLRVGFSPGELLDLLLGFFTVNLAGDDAFPAPPPPPEVTEPRSS